MKISPYPFITTRRLPKHLSFLFDPSWLSSWEFLKLFYEPSRYTLIAPTFLESKVSTNWFEESYE